MDLQEWELLPEEGFLEINEDGGREIYSRKYNHNLLQPSTVFNTNYFICPPQQKHLDLEPVEVDVDHPRDQDPVSQVFFKKMKETEFVDMKVDSPKSITISSKGLHFEEKVDELDSEDEIQDREMDVDGDGGLNIWKLSLNGIGAICSFGVAAAATVCIIIFNKNKIQIYTTADKRMNQNEALPPFRRARITVGGYYNASL